MMFFTAVFSILALSASVQSADPVKLSVYYETLCSDSAKFWTQQLYPVWNDLKDIITLDINCYGKANSTAVGDGYSFECQHGQRECEGNMMINCAKKYAPDEDTFMAFSHCIMQHFMGTDAGPQCARESGVNYEQVESCYTSVEGQLLTQQVGEKQNTLDPSLYYVPWVLINDVFSQEQLDEAEKDLRKVICEAYNGMSPENCNA